MIGVMDKKFVESILQEYEALKEDESVMHNQVLHRHLLQTWRQNSPEMWERLTMAKLAGPLAFVLQERMWREMDSLMKSGMPPTDAREMANKEHLMLEPEDPNPPSRWDELDKAMEDGRALLQEVRSRRL